jgi:hypothetical protein
MMEEPELAAAEMDLHEEAAALTALLSEWLDEADCEAFAHLEETET